MNNNNPLKLSEESKNMILEVSALSGVPQNVVREVLEYLLINWSIKIADSNETESFADLVIPYIGTLGVKYSGDRITETGDLATDVEYYVNLENSFKKLIGDLHDEAKTELVPILQKKIEQAVLVASASTD